MEWVRLTDERIKDLCRLDPHQAGLALRALLRENRATCRCLNCGTSYNVHGDIAGIEETTCDVCNHVSLQLDRAAA